MTDRDMAAGAGDAAAIEHEEEEEGAITLSVAEGGERLDRWLAAQLPDRSRAEVQRWIKDGRVTLGSRSLKASYRVQEGDTVTAEIPPIADYTVAAEAIPLDIVYEDADVIVINKAAGMVVHPAAGNWHGTLVNAVLHHCPDLEGVGGAGRPGIVHRLDKDTSGLILVAKNDRAQRSLQAQFKARAVHKTYLALAHGRMTPQRGRIEAAIGRDPRQRKRMAVVPASLGRAAVTEYDVIAYYGNCTYLSCHPLTGRTHQIRVHLAYVHHPLVGDEVYGGGRRLALRVPRQFLHAAGLRFRLPATQEEMTFTAPLPADLQAVLDELTKETGR